MTLIWATRGKNWGFRFLRDGGFEDPLPRYDAAFDGLGLGDTACRRIGMTVAVRFPDPACRRDSAGRVIPHEFVVFPPLSLEIETVDDALQKIWPLVADDYSAAWDSDGN
jgi:hypothetical protein